MIEKKNIIKAHEVQSLYTLRDARNIARFTANTTTTNVYAFFREKVHW